MREVRPSAGRRTRSPEPERRLALGGRRRQRLRSMSGFDPDASGLGPLLAGRRSQRTRPRRTSRCGQASQVTSTSARGSRSPPTSGQRRRRRDGPAARHRAHRSAQGAARRPARDHGGRLGRDAWPDPHLVHRQPAPVPGRQSRTGERRLVRGPTSAASLDHGVLSRPAATGSVLPAGLAVPRGHQDWSDKIFAGEGEHVADIDRAWDTTWGRVAAVINAMATGDRFTGATADRRGPPPGASSTPSPEPCAPRTCRRPRRRRRVGSRRPERAVPQADERVEAGPRRERLAHAGPGPQADGGATTASTSCRSAARGSAR
jgi:hypothetical protein